jgi:hypothetical protein
VAILLVARNKRSEAEIWFTDYGQFLPTAVAITNDGDADDQDERGFVSQFFAELIPGGPGEGFDTGKQGVVNAFTVANPSAVTRITLSPLANVGFTANRTSFCPQTNPDLQRPDVALFCPDVTAPAGSPVITQDPQGAFPNQLLSALIRGNRLFLPNIGATPEPPVQFTVNVQALVHVIDTTIRRSANRFRWQPVDAVLRYLLGKGTGASSTFMIFAPTASSTLAWRRRNRLMP